MTTLRRFLVLPLALLMMAAGQAFAGQQPHVVTPNQLTAAMTAHTASQDADRATIREALVRPEVKSVAAGLGVDVNRLAAGVDTLAGGDLDRAASAARQVNQQLVGGASTVVISTTTIIVVLLVILLIVVIAK
jgi:hypothetical protein